MGSISRWGSEDREEKVKRIFEYFDLNRDGCLNREEMAALVVGVNPIVKFSDDQIKAINYQIFKLYKKFIDGEKGLTHEGLLRTYDDRVEDVDLDFLALGLDSEPSSSSIPVDQKQRVVTWAAFPKDEIVFDSNWEIVDELENCVDRLKAKQRTDGDLNVHYDQEGCLAELEPFSAEKKVGLNEFGRDYALFLKELEVLRNRVDEQASGSKEKAFDGHMAMGRLLYEHRLVTDALVSFRRSLKLDDIDARSRLWAGNCLCLLEWYKDSEEEFLWAHEIAEVGGNEWDYLLPQIHVNLGIALEKQDKISEASEHYRKAVVLCPKNFRYLKLLGSALLQAEDYNAAEKALEEATLLKPEHADAHCDLAFALHAMGKNERAIQEYRKVLNLRPGDAVAVFNLGRLFMDMSKYRMASAMFGQVLEKWPSNWRALLNRAVALAWVAGEGEEARNAMKRAFKVMNDGVESQDDVIAHIKQLQEKANGGSDERIKGVLDEVLRSYIKFIEGERGGLISNFVVPNYSEGAEDYEDANVSVSQPKPKHVLLRGFNRMRTKQ